MTRICNVCKVEKKLEEYHPDKTNKEGYRTICKVCTNERIQRKRNLRKQGIGIVDVKEKECNKCLITKPRDQFYSDVACKDALSSICKECKNKTTYEWRQKHREKYNKMSIEWGRKNPHRRHAHEIKRRYGCTLEHYNSMLSSQGGACSICKKLHDPEIKKHGRLFVDHDHATGKIRALLCADCNSMLGYAKDDSRILLEAVAYLSRHKVQENS